MNRLMVIFLSMALLAFGIFHALGESDANTRGGAASAPPPTENVATASLAPRTPPVAARSAIASATSEPAGSRPTWLPPESGSTTSNSVPISSQATASQEKIARLSAVLEKLNRLQTQPNVDARAAAAAIAELEQVNGSPVMNGVRLDVLRENIEVADRIQTTAADLQRLQRSSGTPSPEQNALMQAKTTELAALQARLRHDIVQPPGATGIRR